MAIGIQLLTGIPLLYAVLITVLDTFSVAGYCSDWVCGKWKRLLLALVAVIGLSFLTEIILVKPDLGEVVTGFVPHIPDNQKIVYSDWYHWCHGNAT